MSHLVLSVTPGTANVYALRASAIAAAAYHVHGGPFLELDPDQQDQALWTRAREISSLDLLDPALHLPLEVGTTIPQAFSDSNIELAILSASAFAPDASGDILNPDPRPIAELDVGPVRIKWGTSPMSTVSTVLAQFPLLVQRWLKPHVRPAVTLGWGHGTVTRVA